MLFFGNRPVRILLRSAFPSSVQPKPYGTNSKALIVLGINPALSAFPRDVPVKLSCIDSLEERFPKWCSWETIQ